MRFPRPLTVLVCLALVAGPSACTGPSGTGGANGSDRDGATPGTRAAEPEQAVTHLAGTDGAQLAAATSELLLAGSREVVVAAPEDADAVARATEAARASGLPVLLTGDAAAAEVERLGAEQVTTVGEGAAAWAQEQYPSGEPATEALPTDAPADAPTDPSPAPDGPASGTLVLTTGDPAQSAAAATAEAAGAQVRVVPGGDPRGDGELVAELAADEPAHVVALGDAFGPPERLTARLATASTGAQVPGGGQLPLAGRRLVALYGHPGSTSLGALGQQDLDAAIGRVQALAAEYDGLGGLAAVPAFEVIATVASSSPGADGDYSNEADVEDLRPWVDAAGRAGVAVVLDLQCGRSDCLDQAQQYAELLQQPHVGLALDPEWRLHGDQRPLQQIGSMDVEEVNRVGDWLAELTRAGALPQKVFLVHQFRLSMIKGRERLDMGHDELAVVLHADGHGSPELKQGTWQALVADAPPGVSWGWKNFYRQDDPMLTPEQTAAVQPAPAFVSYQ